MSEKSYRLWSMFVENFMGVKLAEVKFDGSSMTAIVGDNGAGKTSFMQAIAVALGGEKLAPDQPIRNGEDRSELIANLGEYIVTRKFERKEGGKISSSITVKSPDGMKYPSPQALLNGLIGKLSFDPLDFTRQDAKKQVETLKEIAGLDFRLLDVQRKTHYDNRTVVNRDVDGLRANVEKMHLVEAPDEAVSVAELLKQQEAEIQVQRQRDALKTASDNALAEQGRAEQRVVRAKSGLEAAKAALEAAQKELAAAEAAVVSAKEKAEEAEGEFAVAPADKLAEIRQQIATAEETNNKVRQKKERAEASRRLRERELEAEALTKKIEEIDQNKRDALAAAQFPVAGLSFVEDEKTSGVTFNGVPFEQVNQATKIRVSMAIGLHLNPKLPLILVRDASLLGEQQLKIVAEMAEEAGAQVLLERVWRPGEVGIHLEDGLVVDQKAVA